MARSFLIIAALIVICAGTANAREWPGNSGLALVEENLYLAVNDLKNSADPKYDAPGPRLTMVRITPGSGIQYEPVVVASADWNDRDGKPSDLEACSAIPGRPYEFLIGESGTFRNRFGRIFHVRISREADDTWVGTGVGPR
jgi:hypothetical protein